MIVINDKTACCGCQACRDVCPLGCITMLPDEEGFLYPYIEQEKCINCGLCEKACPEQNVQPEKRNDNPLACFAATAKDMQVRLQSSSGGVFSLLAKAILDRGGVVFGARFDNDFLAFHSYTKTEEGLPPFRGSKYVQSDLRGVYSQVQAFLKEERPVLFTGTPCQVAGLRSFLHNREDENLYLVSIVCHGAPSPRIWKDYLDSITQGASPTSVNMRDKSNGWNQYRMVVQKDGLDVLNVNATDTTYMKAFLSNLTLRPSCYSCQFRGNHGSDLTLGDYWGIESVHPEMTDNKGTSLVLVYTKKGRQLLERTDLNLRESRYEDVLKGNPSIIHTSWKPVERELFWRSYKKRGLRTLDAFTTFDSRAKLRKIWARLLRKIQRG